MNLKILLLFIQTVFFFNFSEKLKKLRLYAIKFLFGFFSILISYISYSKFVDSIDGFNGIRNITLKKMRFLICLIEKAITFAQSSTNMIKQNYVIEIQDIMIQRKFNQIEKLNTELFFLQKVNEKISDLPLTYFLKKKNRNVIQEIHEILKDFNIEKIEQDNQLKHFLKEKNFLDFVDTSNVDLD